MKMLTFARRCAKEILRDPLNLMFGLGFPGVLLLLLSTIQANIPVPLFEIQYLYHAFFRNAHCKGSGKCLFTTAVYPSPAPFRFYTGVSAAHSPHCFGAGCGMLSACRCIGSAGDGPYSVCPFDTAAHFRLLRFPGSVMRQPFQYQASRRPLRRTTDQSVRMAFRGLV